MFDDDYTKPNKITENIYQGNIFASENKQYLKKLRVTHILVAGCDLNENFPKDFKYLTLNVDDFESENIYQFFESSYEFIDECVTNNGIILIHCAAGISRSTTITCSYLMKKNNLTFEEAFKIVKTARPIAGPNSGFQKQLQIWYEKEVKKNGDKSKVHLSNEEISKSKEKGDIFYEFLSEIKENNLKNDE